MALTVVFALAGSLLCALTYVPVMASLLLRHPAHHDPFVARQCDRLHAWLSAAAWSKPRLVLGAAAILLAGSLALAPLLGTEFIPTLDEGTINLDVLRVPSISLDNAVKDAGRAEKAMLELPEVNRVVSRIGRPELATDTAGPDESDVYVFLKPREEWRVHDREELIGEMEKKLAQRIPETRYAFSQPIENKVNDMIAGIKGDVAIHIYGDDFDRMLAYGQRLLKLLAAIPGAADGKMAPRAGLPSLNIAIDREAVARYGINAGDVLDTIETMGGRCRPGSGGRRALPAAGALRAAVAQGY